MQTPVQFYYYQCYPGPQPSPPPFGYRLSAPYGTLTHNGLPGVFSGARSSHEQLSDDSVNMVASKARSWLANCQEPHQVAAGIQQFAPLLRDQGWTLLIADCGKRGEADKAREVFRAVPRKNVWHHSAFIGALGACGQWKEALAALQHLKQLAYTDTTLQPNHVTYSAAITACARVRRLDIALQLFHEMQTAGLTPDCVTYAIVLSTASRLGAWQPVEQLLETMHSQGMPARPPIYAAYLRQLCRVGQWNRALSTFLVMQELGVAATPVMVLELVQALHCCGRPHMAAHLLKEAEDAGLDDLLRAYPPCSRGMLEQPHASGHPQQHDGRSRCWPPPPPLSPQQQQQQHLDARHSAAAGAAAAAAAAAASDASCAAAAAAAEACGDDASAAAAATAAETADASSGSRQDSLLQHMEACFESCLFFGEDDCASVLQSDAETEEYAGSFASSSEPCSSVATASFAASVMHSMSLLEEPCCDSSCTSSALPSPLLSPMCKPQLAAACMPAGGGTAAATALASTCGKEKLSECAASAAKACCMCSSELGQQQQQQADSAACPA